MADLQAELDCPHCSDKFTFTFPDRRAKGMRRNHTWQMCPKCNRPLEITVSYTKTSYELSVEKAN